MVKFIQSGVPVARHNTQPTNKHGQPHYNNYNDAQNALNNGSLTYGSSYTGVNGDTGYIYSIGGTASGSWYPVANNEAFFDDLCGGNGGSGSECIGLTFKPSDDTVSGAYRLERPRARESVQ